MLENNLINDNNTLEIDKKEQQKQRMKEYYLKNKERIKEQHKKYLQEHQEQYKQYKKKYYAANPEKYKKIWHAYYEKKTQEDPNYKPELFKKMQLRNLNKTLENIEIEIKENSARIMKEKKEELLSRLFKRKNKTKINIQTEISNVDNSNILEKLI